MSGKDQRQRDPSYEPSARRATADASETAYGSEASDAPVVLITGGARGIGFATARYLLSRGYQVAIGDIDAKAGEEAAQALSSHGPVFFFQVDVRSEAGVRECVAAVLTRFARLDALVNNAGIAQASHGSVEELSLEHWNAVLGTNLTGAFLTAKHAASALRDSGGSIVNISSTRALQSETDSEAYAASKGGLLSLTHALSVSLGPGVRVNSVSPGWIEVGLLRRASEQRQPELRAVDHSQHPAGRVGKGEDVAATIAFLVSSEAGFITGQNFVVDGGMTRRMIYEE